MTWRHRVMAALMLLGVVVGLPDLRARVAVEAASRDVDLVADEPSFLSLANAYGVPNLTMLRELRRAGVDALGVPEDTLDSLGAQGRVTVLAGGPWQSILSGSDTPPPGPPGSVAASFPGPSTSPRPPASRTPAAVQPGTYVLVDDSALARWLGPALRSAVGTAVPMRTFAWSGETVVYVAEAPAAVAGLPLGFAPGAFNLARLAGMRVVPRAQSGPNDVSAAGAAGLYAAIASAGVPMDAVLYAGAAASPLPGYPQSAAATARFYARHDWLLGVLETPEQLGNVDQPGTSALAAALGERVVRAYGVPSWMILDDTPEEITDAIFSQVADFNIRLVYLHPLQSAPDPIGQTLSLVRAVVRQLHAGGYVLGHPQPFRALEVGRLQRLVQGLAVVSAALLLLEGLLPTLAGLGYQPLAVVGALAVLLCGGSAHLSTVVCALGAGLSFGGLAVLYFARTWNRSAPDPPRFGAVWRRGAVAAVTMAGISLAGALIIATVMGSTMFFLEWQYFRGVKLTFLTIPFVALLAFLAWVGTGAAAAGGPPGPGRPGSDRAAAAVGREPGAAAGGGNLGRGDQVGRRTGARLIAEVAAAGRQPVRVKHVAAFALVAALGAIYLVRSGNAPSAFVPTLEVQLRDALQNLLLYRPREKDFLVGYPAVMIASFFGAHRRRWPFFFFLLGASVAPVAMVDSFGTLRTPFIHSLLREGYGLLLGVAVGTVGLALLHWAWSAWTRPSTEPVSEAQAAASLAGRG